MRFYEDIRVGETAEIGRHTFTVEEIKAFAARFDPQPFHLDEAAGARSMFGRLCASGWHTACMWMGLMVRHRQGEDAERRARGEPVAALGAAQGFGDLRWLTPVDPGDTITSATEIIDARASISRPEWGIIMSRNTGTNQHGEPVLSFVSSVFVERKQK